jgi:hypothetical protein
LLTIRFSGIASEIQWDVKLRKVIQQRIRKDADGVSLAGGIDAVVSANVNEPGTTRTSRRTKTRIVQRNGRTEVFETETDAGSGKEEKK